jgi:hypothetical protein
MIRLSELRAWPARLTAVLTTTAPLALRRV